MGKDDARQYIKFKVEVDLQKSIVTGWTLDQGTDNPLWIKFKYERLPNICFSCGKFDHETRLCSLLGSQENAVNRYGPWLRA